MITVNTVLYFAFEVPSSCLKAWNFVVKMAIFSEAFQHLGDCKEEKFMAPAKCYVVTRVRRSLSYSIASSSGGASDKHELVHLWFVVFTRIFVT